MINRRLYTLCARKRGDKGKKWHRICHGAYVRNVAVQVFQGRLLDMYFSGGYEARLLPVGDRQFDEEFLKEIQDSK